MIENQALVWLGSMYAPLLPVFGLAANIFSFYFKLLLAVWLHSPPKTRYSASRTSNLAYGLMLRTYKPIPPAVLVPCVSYFSYCLIWTSSITTRVVDIAQWGDAVVMGLPLVHMSTALLSAFMPWSRDTAEMRHAFKCLPWQSAGIQPSYGILKISAAQRVPQATLWCSDGGHDDSASGV